VFVQIYYLNLHDISCRCNITFLSIFTLKMARYAMINIVLLVFSTDERLNFLQINFYCTTLVQVQLKQEIA